MKEPRLERLCRFSSAALGVALAVARCGTASAKDAGHDGTVGEVPAREATVTASLTEGVRVTSEDTAFKFESHFAFWARGTVEAREGSTAENYFEVPLVRPLWQVSAFDGMLALLVQPELAGSNPHLLDMTMDFVVDPAFQLRLGQFRTPYSRAFITPIIKLAMPDRGPVSDIFRADRDTGLMMSGQLGKAVEYNLGVFNGSGINSRVGDTSAPMVIGRMVVTPYGAVPYDQVPSLSQAAPSGLAIGIEGLYRERSGTGADEQAVAKTSGIGAELSVVQGPFTLFSEGYLREQRLDGGTTTSWGAFVQAGLFVIPRAVELSARAGWIDPDTDAGGTVVQSYEGTIKGYLHVGDIAYGHHLSLGTQYRFTKSRQPFGAIASGNNHRVTAQLQIWI